MRVLLNGLGRIGKNIFRLALQNKKINIVAINEINNNIENIAYNINFDSTYGNLKDKFKAKRDYIKNKKHKIKITHHKDIDKLNLKNIDMIIDASGVKQNIATLNKLDVKKIILTHPNSNITNIVLGVNDHELLNNHKIISTSSCNATALLPLLKILDSCCDIQYGDITTIHPLLNHQKVLDGNCIGSSTKNIACNFEFGRSSLTNIIPSQTTTIKACSYIIPKFQDILTSSSLRVPTQTVGAISVVLFVKYPKTKQELITLLKDYQKNQQYKIIKNNFKPLVSSDFKSSKYTTIIDHRYTQIKDNMIKIILWYDNEYGYASKVLKISALSNI